MEHVVASGETLASIAGRYGTDWRELARANGISNPNLIRAGQRLNVPGGGGVAVRPGDTLSGIAARAGVSAQALARANGISNPDRIRPGQMLRIPGTGTPARTAGRSPTTREQARPAPAPTSAAQSANGNRYVNIIRQHGDQRARDDLAAGLKVLVALRTPTNVRKHLHGVYDDTIAIVRQTESGEVQVREFAGNTEPSGIYAHGAARAHKGSSVDMNGDGKMDSGRLVVGTYRYVRQPGIFADNVYFKADRIQVAERDTNQDGNFDARDPNRIDRRGAQRTMYIHQGSNNATGSAGCQTVRKRDYATFLGAIGAQRSFSYVLVNR